VTSNTDFQKLISVSNFAETLSTSQKTTIKMPFNVAFSKNLLEQEQSLITGPMTFTNNVLSVNCQSTNVTNKMTSRLIY